jgi:hypothetical protein
MTALEIEQTTFWLVASDFVKRFTKRNEKAEFKINVQQEMKKIYIQLNTNSVFGIFFNNTFA